VVTLRIICRIESTAISSAAAAATRIRWPRGSANSGVRYPGWMIARMATMTNGRAPRT